MSQFTRLTLIHAGKRAEVVVASDQPLAALIPRICDLLGLPPGSNQYALVRPLGESLDLQADCPANQIGDGETLCLVDWSDAPAPPVVVDVTDSVAALRGEVAGQWTPAVRQWLATCATAAGCLMAGFLVPWGDLIVADQALILVAVTAGLTAVAVLTGRFSSERAAVVLSAAVTGLCVPAGVLLGRWASAPDSMTAILFAVLTLISLTGGTTVGFGLRNRAVTVSAVICGSIAALGLILMMTGLPDAQAWAVTGVTSVVALGLIPAWALSASGLTGLDDFTTDGSQVTRQDVAASAATAYGVLAWCVTGCAVLAGLAAGMLAWTGPDTGWAVALAGVIVLLLALRTRSMPLAVPAITLWCTVLVAVGVCLWGLPVLPRLIGFVCVALLCALSATVTLPDHVRLRLRRWGDIFEKLATAATLPIVLGLFGVYENLLGAF